MVTTAAAPTVLPGPAILYAPPATAPQLQNIGIWNAPPILVSGAAAYRDGEYLYQDYLYDDHGARSPQVAAGAGGADPSDRRGNNTFSQEDGTYTYPSNRAYADNAADLVELRVKPLPSATAFRLTMNTMKDPTLIAASIALGGTAGIAHPFPFGANVVAPASEFLTLHPSAGSMVGTLTDALTGATIPGPTPAVTVDTVRRQITVMVPHSAWNPTGQTAERLAAGVGLWDTANNRYLIPQQSNDATHAGGAGGLNAAAAFFNVAYRFHEPYPMYGTAILTQIANGTTWWRDNAQATALTAGDISPLFASVDFTKLAGGVDDESGVPQTGSMDRILASHFETAQGVDYSSSCYGGDLRCQYQGQLQPYNIYVPSHPAPPAGYGMTLLLHGNSANYNEFFATRNQSEFGERGTGSIVISPEDRDPGSSFTGYGAVDAFEVWADAGRVYHLDPTWRTVSGYSLGGLGTYKFIEQFPDLFSRAVAIVGTPGGPPQTVPSAPYVGGAGTAELATLRNIPIMIWDVIPLDELNPLPELNALALDRLGYRYDWLAFPGEHLTPSINDEYGPAATFLGTYRVQPNPSHITYVYDASALDALARPYGDFPELGFVADHAYWLSALRLRNGGQGTVDSVSHGFGIGDPKASGTQHGAGVLTGGALVPVLPYVETFQTWGPTPSAPLGDALDITASNVKSVTVDTVRARVDCNVTLHVITDGPMTVTLAGCARTVSFQPMTGSGVPNTGATARAAWTPAAIVLGGVTLAIRARRRRRGRRPWNQ